MRVAVVHEWLTTYAGSEQVVAQILNVYPQADLFAVCDFLPERDRALLGNRRATTTFIQHLPFAAKKYRQYLPLMPLAIEQLDLSGYDLVISSNHAVAKGVITGPDQLHVCYVHSPVRYAWDLQHQYLAEAGLARGAKSWLARWMLHKVRLWDRHTAAGVDAFIANSCFIARRIRKTWRREAEVIYPPVAVDAFVRRDDKEDFYLTASRMVPYKRIPLIVEAFMHLPHLKLKVVGDGPEFGRVRAAAGPNVEVLGYQEASALRDLMQRAKAFVFAAEEDFGITLVEAQACGTPVIAYGKGGALETIRGLDSGTDAPTGLFFTEQTAGSLAAAVGRFEQLAGRMTSAACVANAARFSEQRFRDEFGISIERLWSGTMSPNCRGLQ